jgi:hypothetical protein
MQALQHDSPGIEGDAFRLKRREALGDDVGIDELLYGQRADQDVGSRGGFACAVGAGDDYKVGRHWPIVTRGRSAGLKPRAG